MTTFDNEMGPGVRTVRHNPTVPVSAVDAVRARIAELTGMADGWLDGFGLAPTASALADAYVVLVRLLTAHPEAPRPRVYPTPEGGLQAEWSMGRVAADLTFPPQRGPLVASAVHIDSDRESEASFDGAALALDPAPLSAWLKATANLALPPEAP